MSNINEKIIFSEPNFDGFNPTLQNYFKFYEILQIQHLKEDHDHYFHKFFKPQYFLI